LGMSPGRSQSGDCLVRVHRGRVLPAALLVRGQEPRGGVGSRRASVGVGIAEADALVVHQRRSGQLRGVEHGDCGECQPAYRDPGREWVFPHSDRRDLQQVLQRWASQPPERDGARYSHAVERKGASLQRVLARRARGGATARIPWAAGAGSGDPPVAERLARIHGRQRRGVRAARTSLLARMPSLRSLGGRSRIERPGNRLGGGQSHALAEASRPAPAMVSWLSGFAGRGGGYRLGGRRRRARSADPGQSERAAGRTLRTTIVAARLHFARGGNRGALLRNSHGRSRASHRNVIRLTAALWRDARDRWGVYATRVDESASSASTRWWWNGREASSGS